MIWGPRRQEASNFDVVYLIKKTRRGHREFFGLRADTASAGSEPKRLAAAVLLINSHRTYAVAETYCNVQGLPASHPTHPLTRRSSISLATSSHMSANSKNSFLAKEFSSSSPVPGISQLVLAN